MAAKMIESSTQELIDSLQDLSIYDEDQGEMKKGKKSITDESEEMTSMIASQVGVGCENSSNSSANNCSSYHYGVCAICLNKIILQETALVKGCEHAYCVTCILRWASYKKDTTCPQCKHPFEFLNVHRSLDGSIHDYMFEESVCLLLRAAWFEPLVVDEKYDVDYEMEYFYPYEEEEEEDLDEVYFGTSSSLRIGNRRWGDNGYVRAGRQEARPVHRTNIQESSAGPSRQPKKKEAGGAKESVAVGRRAKRALKREAADKAAAAKHQEHLVRLGRK